MQRYFKITLLMLIAYLLLFCIVFGTPIISGKAASQVLTWVGCKPAGFDSPFHCPGANPIGERFGPLSGWLVSLIMQPFIFFIIFWDILLGWLALIVLLAILTLVASRQAADKKQEATADTGFIDVLLIWTILPLLCFAWLRQIPLYWAILPFIFVFLTIRLHRPSALVDILLFFLAVGTLQLARSGHPQEGWLALTIASALIAMRFMCRTTHVKEGKSRLQVKNHRTENMATAEYAGFISRSRASGIDAILILLLVFPLLILVDGWNYFSGVTTHPVNEPLDFIFFRAFPAVGTAVYPPLALLCYGNDIGPAAFILTRVLPVIAVIGFWVWRQATPGKQMFSLKIVDAASGNPASPGQLIGRYFAYTLSLLPLGLGFLWIIFDKQHQGWHDKLTGTAVIRPRTADTLPAL